MLTDRPQCKLKYPTICRGDSETVCALAGDLLACMPCHDHFTDEWWRKKRAEPKTCGRCGKTSGVPSSYVSLNMFVNTTTVNGEIFNSVKAFQLSYELCTDCGLEIRNEIVRKIGDTNAKTGL